VKARSSTNGIRGRQAVTAQIRKVAAVYSDMTNQFRHDVADGRLEERTALVDGMRITGAGVFHFGTTAQWTRS
jgi:hypothetical protein